MSVRSKVRSWRLLRRIERQHRRSSAARTPDSDPVRAFRSGLAAGISEGAAATTALIHEAQGGDGADGHDVGQPAAEAALRPEEGQLIRFTYQLRPGSKVYTLTGRYIRGAICSPSPNQNVLTRRWDRVTWWCDAELAELIDDEIVRQLTDLLRDHPIVVAALEEIRS